VTIGALLVLLSLAAAGDRPVYADPYSSRDLIEDSSLLDGKRVTYRGEAVTAVMMRGDAGWINVGDQYNAIGVWATHAMLDTVKVVGDYKHNGDILEIEGVFNRACPVHGGQLDIHADAFRLIKTGSLRAERIDQNKLFIATCLFFLALVLTIIFRRRM
jgi:hypothetical protein